MYYLMLDVGGTNLKAGVLTEEGNLLQDNILSFDARAKAGEKEIFCNFVEILNVLTERIPEPQPKIGGVGMAFPGPFDYEKGISLMRGLDKYDAIYGIPIGKRVREGFRSSRNGAAMEKDCPFLFLHDIEAFAIGESHFGELAGSRRVMYLCMGTGAGSAFSEDQKILKEDERIPKNGWIYKTPFRESILDDYLSVRGLARLSQEFFGEPKSGLELFELCKAGDERALAVYRGFGSWVLEGVVPFLDSFRPEGVVLGGQLSKSFSYFGEELLLESRRRGIQVCLTEDTSRRALQGLYLQIGL